jgi:hypothetical protein
MPGWSNQYCNQLFILEHILAAKVQRYEAQNNVFMIFLSQFVLKNLDFKKQIINSFIFYYDTSGQSKNYNSLMIDSAVCQL